MAGSSSSNNTNSDDKPSIEWLELNERLKRTPSKATRNSDYEHTMVIANELLKIQDKSFNYLTDDQQALLMFMIMKDTDKTLTVVVTRLRKYSSKLSTRRQRNTIE